MAHPLICASHAGIAQLVERNLAKVEVASSSLVSRSSFRIACSSVIGFRQQVTAGQVEYACKPYQKPRFAGVLFFKRQNSTGLVAEWSCSGLQIRVRRFDSDPGLQNMVRASLPESFKPASERAFLWLCLVGVSADLLALQPCLAGIRLRYVELRRGVLIRQPIRHPCYRRRRCQPATSFAGLTGRVRAQSMWRRAAWRLCGGAGLAGRYLRLRELCTQ